MQYSIALDVDIIKPTDRSYVRPNETVLLVLTAVTDSVLPVTFEIDFGDGTMLKTFDVSVRYVTYTVDKIIHTFILILKQNPNCRVCA